MYFFLQCNLCQKTFGGIQDLELHNCPAVRKMSTAAPPSGNDTSQLSILPQLREVRLPEKHALVMNPVEDRDGPSPNKKPRLTILPQQQQIPVNSMINQTRLNQTTESMINQTRLNQTTGGIVTVTKAPTQSVHHHGGKLFFLKKKLIKIARNCQ